MYFFILEVGSGSDKRKIGFNFNKLARMEKEESNKIKFKFKSESYVKYFNTEEERDFYFDYIAIKLDDIELLFNKNIKTKYIRLPQDEITNTSQIIYVNVNNSNITFQLESEYFYLSFRTQKEAEDYFYSLMKKIGAIELKNEA
ncbi:hypothetical protein QE177_15145 (plasmid) [Arsenophonus sp. aPb]|uniref:hypothetical protein n=1 Tax=Arsenophonus sp. aPb TaxID=3041619 RepID=UPI0024693521|nr:hypothetical protein [Arsenophonus sp. aPb]WGL99835.1 hypothetical protein QE177_15145 [Arsenophonus sp. aPb]